MGISMHKFVAGGLGRHTRTRVHGQIHGQDRPLWTDLRPRCHPALLRNSPLKGSSGSGCPVHSLARRADPACCARPDGRACACRPGGRGGRRQRWLVTGDADPTAVGHPLQYACSSGPWDRPRRAGIIKATPLRGGLHCYRNEIGDQGEEMVAK